MSGLEIVRYISLLMSLRYWEGSTISSPSVSLNLRLRSIGVSNGFELRKRVSIKSWVAYFFDSDRYPWMKWLSLGLKNTSSCPNFLRLNTLYNRDWVVVIVLLLDFARIMSSTYGRSITRFCPTPLVKRDGSAVDCLKSFWRIMVENLENHYLKACLRPYRDLLSLHTMFSHLQDTPKVTSCRLPLASLHWGKCYWHPIELNINCFEKQWLIEP